MPKLPKKTETAHKDLLREILNGVTLTDVKILDKLQGDERRDFLKYCYGVVNNPHFKMLGEYLSLLQLQKTAGSSDMKQVEFGQATLNGISFFGEILQKYANEYERLTVPQAKFEKHRSFEPTYLNK